MDKNSFLNELKLLQQVPQNWRMPLAALGVGIVLLLVWIVVAVNSEMPKEMTAQQVKQQDEREQARTDKVVPKNADAVTQLFNPPIAQTTEEQRRTNATAQVDNILTTVYYLSDCDMLPQAEYADAYQLLVAYAKYQRLGATPQEANAYVGERAKAMNASYRLVYANRKCERSALKPVKESLDKWREATRLIAIRGL